MDKEVKGFKCKNSSIEQQIEDSYYITLLKQAYGHQIIIDDSVVGYYMLYFKGIEFEEVNQIMDGDYSSSMADYYMSVHIRYIAIDERLQHKGIGKTVLKALITQLMNLSKLYPIRLITLDALNEYHDWYYNIGFRDIPGIENNGITTSMYIDCMTKEDAEKFEAFCENYYY